MRLIKINDGKEEGPQLEDFTHRIHKRPNYAIFSHRWLSQEDHGGDVTFEEFTKSKDKIKQVAEITDREERKDTMRTLGLREAAFDKMLQAIRLASDEGATYVWIDSCCIDRSNSSELTEALNSMYRYYEEATKCLVYLHDFAGTSKEESYDFKTSEWFTRGWTLQELIAPGEVLFYNRDWNFLGHRFTFEIAQAILEATNIPREILTGERKPYQYTVAQRMSWAADRKTTRGEDMSYSLCGLFDVNLVPIYGEGARKAFLRLQEAIMSSSNDMTLFAWKSNDSGDEYRGILARSPNEFKDAGTLVHKRCFGPSPEFSMTNRGLKIAPCLGNGRIGGYILPLNCADIEDFDMKSLCISLSHWGQRNGELYRDEPGRLLLCDRVTFPLTKQEEPIYIVRDERHQKDTSDLSRQTEQSRAKRGISSEVWPDNYAS